MFAKHFKLPIITLVFSMSIFVSCDDNDDLSLIEAFKENIIGNWQSQDSEFDETTHLYGLRTLILNALNWEIIIQRFADEEKTIPLFNLMFEGPYEITEASNTVSDAYNGAFSFTRKIITVFADPAMLGLSGCGIIINEPFDYSDTGCAWLESVEHCNSDYDLVSYENDTLTPGRRTDNMCEEEGRPTERGFPMLGLN